MHDLISKPSVIEPDWEEILVICDNCGHAIHVKRTDVKPTIEPKYEPVKAEDFARTMSENTHYSFMAWHSEALELMERQGFVICKKMM